MFGGINNIYMGGCKFFAHCTNISVHKIYSRASLFISGEYFLDRTAIMDDTETPQNTVVKWVHVDSHSVYQFGHFSVWLRLFPALLYLWDASLSLPTSGTIMVTKTITRMMESPTTEIPPDGVEALDTPFGSTVYAPPGRRYRIPSWVCFG